MEDEVLANKAQKLFIMMTNGPKNPELATIVGAATFVSESLSATQALIY
jgi:predicted peroxiredoxin